MALTICGETAELRWGYRLAAALGAWTIEATHGTPSEPQPIRRELRARVLTAEPLALRQRPLTLVVPRPTTVWRWPVLEVVIVSGVAGELPNVMATLGPKEGVTHVAVRSA
jgi:hypothetical protein